VDAMRAEARGGRTRLTNIALTDAMVEVLSSLTDAGAKEFSDQMLKALAEAKEADDITPINAVIESWYRTMVFVEKEGFDEAYKTARDPQRKKKPRPIGEVLRRRSRPQGG
jgi:Family of unknown function (DUF6247)